MSGIRATHPNRDVSRRKNQTILCTLVLAFLSNFCFYAAELPLLSLVERRICEKHYDDGAGGHHNREYARVDGSCKIPQIQNKVALIVGYKTAFDAIPPLLTSLWYGSLANRIGRRPVIALACSGELLNILVVVLVGFSGVTSHIEWIWVSALMLTMGGGQFLLYAIFDVILVDITKEAERLQWLSILHSTTILNVLYAAPLAAVLMQQSLWIPFVAIICAALTRYPIIWFLPETAQIEKCAHTPIAQENHPQNLAESEPTQPLLNEVAAESTHHPTVMVTLRALLSCNGIPFCFMCFLVKRIAFTSEFLMFQYASELLHEPLDKTAWIRIPLGFSATLVSTLCLPVFFRALRHQRANNGDLRWEMRAVRTSLFILMTGFGLYWMASTYPVMSVALLLCGAGEGLAPSLQGVASAVVAPRLHTNLFATISIIDTTAKLFGGPIMSAAFSLRNEYGKTHGYCFALSMILFALLWCSSWATSPIRERPGQ